MISVSEARKLALSLPEATEQDHFGRPSFRIRGKIFSTLWPVEKRAMVKLSAVDQSVFTSFDSQVFYPVPGGWGRQGATFVELRKVKKSMLRDALTAAWQLAAPKKLALAHFGGNA
jgi:hypothetical protein